MNTEWSLPVCFYLENKDSNFNCLLESSINWLFYNQAKGIKLYAPIQ